jgi:hypothetical protein
MEIFLNEKGILTHISRTLVELQEEFRLTGDKNQETRSAKQKKPSYYNGQQQQWNKTGRNYTGIPREQWNASRKLESRETTGKNTVI